MTNQTTECRYCRFSNGTWTRNLMKTVYACRLGHDTRAVHCDFFEREPGSDDDIDIYEGSVQDLWS